MQDLTNWPFFQFVAQNALQCRSESECLEAAYCSGTSATCPESSPRADNTVCGCTDGNCSRWVYLFRAISRYFENLLYSTGCRYPGTASRVCASGLCNASICTAYGAVECELPELKQACHIACQGSGFGDGTQCVSTFETDKTPDGLNATSLGAGFPCANLTGYCDADNVCRTVESEDALRELEDLLKNLDQDTIMAWIRDNPATFGGIMAAMVVVCVALYVTRRRPTKFEPECAAQIDAITDYASSH